MCHDCHVTTGEEDPGAQAEEGEEARGEGAEGTQKEDPEGEGGEGEGQG